MTTITVTYSNDDMDEFRRAHFSGEAWSALQDIQTTVSMQQKHGKRENDSKTLEAVISKISDVLWRVE